MFKTILKSIKQFGTLVMQRIQAWLKATTKPVTTSLAFGTAEDLLRSKTELVMENALLRQQLIVVNRSVKRSRLTRTDRWLMMLLSSKVQHWTQALLIIQPETMLRWHRDLFKWLWRRKSQHKGGKPPLSAQVIALIRQMAVENRLWGVKRIHGELLKLGLRVSKRTIRKYMRRARPPQPQGQTWLTFLHNQAEAIWACDFIQVSDVFFRSLFAFVIVELSSRRVVHIGVTGHPSDAWAAQQLREATPFGLGPKHLIRDNDDKYGAHFAAVAASARIDVITTPVEAPRANGICERFVGSVRRECLDHLLVFGEGHLRRILEPISTTSIRCGHIKASPSAFRFRRPPLHCHQGGA
jgi:putative transposase